MSRIRSLLLFSMIVIFCSAIYAEECGCGTPHDEGSNKNPPAILSDEEIDMYLAATLKRHENLKWFSANIVQIKSGGIFKRPNEQKGTIKVELPKKLVLDMSDDGVMIVADGTYLWIYDTDLGEVERWHTEGYEKPEGDSLDMAGMLLGADVKTVEEMRDLYNITATYGSGLINYVLLPIKGKPAERYSRIELSMTEDALLPMRTRMTSIQKEGEIQPPAVVEYYISNFKSNTTGLKPFKEFTFIFPMTKEIEVRDMDKEGGETVVPYKQVMEELGDMISAEFIPETEEENQE